MNKKQFKIFAIFAIMLGVITTGVSMFANESNYENKLAIDGITRTFPLYREIYHQSNDEGKEKIEAEANISIEQVYCERETTVDYLKGNIDMSELINSGSCKVGDRMSDPLYKKFSYEWRELKGLGKDEKINEREESAMRKFIYDSIKEERRVLNESNK